VKKKILAGTVLAAGALIGHLHASLQTYHPVMKVAASDGITYTVVLDPTPSRPTCSSAGKTFLEPLREQCPDCEVLSARCESDLEELALALETEQPLPMYVVSMSGARVAIDGEDSRARAACELIAGDAVRRGAARANCLRPATVPKTDTGLAGPGGFTENRTTP
jgi:hypothetical protein